MSLQTEGNSIMTDLPSIEQQDEALAQRLDHIRAAKRLFSEAKQNAPDELAALKAAMPGIIAEHFISLAAGTESPLIDAVAKRLVLEELARGGGPVDMELSTRESAASRARNRLRRDAAA